MKLSYRILSLQCADVLVIFAWFLMQSYLTDVWEISITHAAAIINIWNGLSKILPVFFLFLADAFLGHFMMLVIFSVAYSLGISCVVMSTPPFLGHCKKYEKECIDDAQKVIFYIGMALIAAGRAGYAVSVRHFRKEQLKEADGNTSNTSEYTSNTAEVQNELENRTEQPEKADKNTSISNRLKSVLPVLLIILIAIVAAIALSYIKVKPWSIIFGIPAICTLVSTLLFFSGWCNYNKVEPSGSPITDVCRVFVAFFHKRSYRLYHRGPYRFYKKDNQESFTRTRFLRFLENAAIIDRGDVTRDGQIRNRWKLCSVLEVEEAKIAVRMVPMWLTFIVCGMVSSIGNTYFIEQAKHMNRKIGKWNVPIVVPVLLIIGIKPILDLFVKKYFLKKASAHLNDKKYLPAKGIGIAMVFSILCCITAAITETERLRVIRKHGLLDKPDEHIPMSLYWLIFQFCLLVGLQSFSEKCIAAFHTDQGPKSMKHYLGHFGNFVLGLGFMCSVLSVYVVGKISERGGKTNWFQFTLNKSRLDRYYWFLAGLSSVNLAGFVMVASCYRYKDIENDIDQGDETNIEGYLDWIQRWAEILPIDLIPKPAEPEPSPSPPHPGPPTPRRGAPLRSPSPPLPPIPPPPALPVILIGFEPCSLETEGEDLNDENADRPFFFFLLFYLFLFIVFIFR